ncbi:hypothetical protein [Aporhodopirellula aestuarii]|uniref:Uncharacterized protein n=1 Tax=Aporhodopirellula aestuarii TaxID=2950107 RepID=A0ABT0U9W9_9BACT|nr:hypothetical protein [Aporhodopirellula aestuarii]MCM2373479.1 hypothetical protein [Aporhodopirellula aestuarii]
MSRFDGVIGDRMGHRSDAIGEVGLIRLLPCHGLGGWRYRFLERVDAPPGVMKAHLGLTR